MNPAIIRLHDGPHRTNALQAPATMGWPLPEKLLVAKSGLMEMLAVADAEKRDSLPADLEWTEYTKVEESKLTDEQAAEMSMVVRGAGYSVEPDAWNKDTLAEPRPDDA